MKHTKDERFVKGEVDVMPIPLKGAEKYSAGIQKKVMTGICESLYLDLQTEGPLQCREFRQALNYALNRVESVSYTHLTLPTTPYV